ncbi:hypothetical protein N657DRAFT_641011 [Parathielavia appendiculata]|uniref:Uncharacterized protein n=1 Tax=Parathielavia appendiculata TaxID=2587402 RepID=A0AAN6Z630_9PEZI|nr:hypothetical protein N657DRAFT_641011 [Parathielavia appendiculata]
MVCIPYGSSKQVSHPKPTPETHTEALEPARHLGSGHIPEELRARKNKNNPSTVRPQTSFLTLLE